MRSILFILLFAITHVTFAQDSTKVKVPSPKIVSKLEFGKALTINDVELRFVEVVQDSRCPKNVSCIWAGEVIIKVDVFEKGKKTTRKTITLKPAYQLKDLIGNLFTSDDLNISGFNVMPYPVSGNKIPTEDYYIQIDVKH